MKNKLVLLKWEDYHLMHKVEGIGVGFLVTEDKDEITLASDKFSNGNKTETIYDKSTIKKIIRKSIEL